MCIGQEQEYWNGLNYAQRLLPTGVTPTLGPDGTGVGHVFWYTLDTKIFDLGEQQALQDWYVKLAFAKPYPVLPKWHPLAVLKNNC